MFEQKQRMHVKVRNNEDVLSMLRTAEVALSMISKENPTPQKTKGKYIGFMYLPFVLYPILYGVTVITCPLRSTIIFMFPSCALYNPILCSSFLQSFTNFGS